MSKKADLVNLLDRGTVDVIVREDLEKKINSGKKLNVKLGIDPSGADLHLGHMVVIKKLKEFQDLGHKIFLLFGNFTGQIGDPTDKLQARTEKTQKELEKNAKKYLEQAGKILDTTKVEVVWNADWLKKMTLAEMTRLSKSFTVARMLERDMYQERIKRNEPIYIHEFLYPLMQGYDSVALKADLELGGTDQTFNLLAGRTIQEAYGQLPQNILTVPILEGTDGKMKMGKTTKNYIGVTDTPREMYGKTMSIPDNIITKYFELATNIPIVELNQIRESLKKGENPKNLKTKLAKEIVTIYHDKKAADTSEMEFAEIFSNKGQPDEIETIRLKAKSWNVVELVSQTGLITSKSEIRRLIEGGGVKIDGKKIGSIDEQYEIENGTLLQIGKRRFIKLKRV